MTEIPAVEYLAIAWSDSRPPISQMTSHLCHIAARLFGATELQVRSRRRFSEVVAARHWVWQQLREEGYTFPQIAREFGVDHSSVQYAMGSTLSPSVGASEIADLLAEGERDTGEVARAMGVRRSIAANRLESARARGIVLRKYETRVVGSQGRRRRVRVWSLAGVPTGQESEGR